MKPPPFDYAVATSIDEVLALLAGERDARVLAGGQSLLPLLNLRLAGPELLVDIGRVPELQGTTIDDGGLTVGAGVIQADLAADERVSDRWPLLTTAIDHIGHPQIRHRGTVCGSLAHGDPLAELPAVAMALDATMLVRSATGERTVPAAAMFVGSFMTALEPDELLVGVRFPPQPPGGGWGFREFAPRDGDFATAGVVVSLRAEAGVVTEARVVLFGLGGAPTRAEIVEQALIGSGRDAIVDGAVLERLADSLDPPDDIHGSAATRRQLAVTLTGDAIADALERMR